MIDLLKNLHKCIDLWISINRNMNLHNWFMESYDGFMDLHNSIMKIQNSTWIMEIQDWLVDIHIQLWRSIIYIYGAPFIGRHKLVS